MTSDNARQTAFDPRAPQDERTDALGELQKSHTQPSVMSAEVFAQMIEMADMNKSISQNVVPFPGTNQGKPGMQSVRLDDRQLGLQGEYWEKPASMSFDALRAMVDQTPILNAVVMTRIRQVQRFCRVQEGGSGLGFMVKHIDKEHSISKTEQDSIGMLNRFMSNCGWEFNPRERKKLHRDSFAGFMGKAVRDSLVLDSCAIETEMKRDRKLGIDGLTVVDGSTIRLTPETGYKGDPEIFALQVIQGGIRTAYTNDDLIYEPRNPRSDIMVGGYGLGETELLVRVVTGFLNAMSHNISGFDKNAIPKGVLHLSGDYSQDDLTAFRRYWNSMVKGANSHWSVPVLISKDQESKASFEKFGVEFDDMAFSKWMTFLASLICAIYGMSPAEVNFDSFTAGSTSALGGNDTAEKLAASKDSGLRPILSYFENLFTDYITCDFSEKYVFRWEGLDEEDTEVKDKRAGLILTVNEMRAQEGYDKMDGKLGDAPLNPSLIGPWMQIMQAEQPEDFGGQEEGQPGEEQAPGGDPAEEQQAPGEGQDEEQEEPAAGFGGAESGKDFGAGSPDDEPAAKEEDKPDDEEKPLAKSLEPDDFGTRTNTIYRLGDL
ncbi:phage portal protein [Propionivibrio sp.]|uniref:phage portal protein n=1 Tax=Propionivibrio sp. TaxID=2212460 RepID=UPI003BF2833C